MLKYQKFILAALVLFLNTPTFSNSSESSAIIELKPGSNEISIKILNKSDLDLYSVQLLLQQGDLPEGVAITQNSTTADISANNKSGGSLLLQIEVSETTKRGEYEIPFSLKDNNGNIWEFKFLANVDVPLPEKYELFQNYPNPFNSNTQIKYALLSPEGQRTQLIIFDVLGRQIRKLVDKEQVPGLYKLVWDGNDDYGVPVSSGIYFYRIASGSFVETRKLIMLE